MIVTIMISPLAEKWVGYGNMARMMKWEVGMWFPVVRMGVCIPRDTISSVKFSGPQKL